MDNVARSEERHGRGFGRLGTPLTLAVFLTLGGAHCEQTEEECIVGATRCEGDLHQHCMSLGPGSPIVGWLETDCSADGQVCRDADGLAACVLADESCPAAMLAVCVDGAVYDCMGMGLVFAWACDAACVEYDDYAFCTLDSAPCPDGVDALCDGDRLVTCSIEGYPVDEEDCSEEGLACVADGSAALCE